MSIKGLALNGCYYKPLTLIVAQNIVRGAIFTAVPVFPHCKKRLWFLNVFFHILWSITALKRKCDKSVRLQCRNMTIVVNLFLSQYVSSKLTIYPFVKSKRKSWKPMVSRSQISHSIISFLTNGWVWSMLGTPSKLSPVLLFPWWRSCTKVE